MRIVGWVLFGGMLTLAAAVLLAGFGDQDACVDAGGRWLNDRCDGSAGIVPLAERPHVWLVLAATMLVGLTFLFRANGRATSSRSTAPPV
jgi:hypothetical protein